MIKIYVLIFWFIFQCNLLFADHGPNRLWERKIEPYFTVHEDNYMGPFKVNVHSFGKKNAYEVGEIKKKNYDKYFDDKYNLATIVKKDGKIIYARFNKQKKIDANTLIQGMSMSKTALSAVVASLKCSGLIETLDDKVSKYSPTLANTPYKNVTIKNILQMNSGVTPLKEKYKKKMNRMAVGTRDYEEKGSVLNALLLLNENIREQGKLSNYHTGDTFALSLLISDITNKPASQIFYENIFLKWNKNNGLMHWISDKDGITVSQAHLTMSPYDWSNFGGFILDQISSKTCIGNFFLEGLENGVETIRENVKYGYLFWIYNVKKKPTIVMTGHGGFFNVLNQKTNSVLTILSVDPGYKKGNLFNNISQISGKIK